MNGTRHPQKCKGEDVEGKQLPGGGGVGAVGGDPGRPSRCVKEDSRFLDCGALFKNHSFTMILLNWL